MTTASSEPKRLLIANRGEIARRVARGALRQGFEVGVLVADDDTDSVAAEFVSPHGRVRVSSYLDVPGVVAAAQAWGAQFLHPGYGFLSERAEFARACEAAGIVFVGPTAEQMLLLGDKENAKRLALHIGVPTLQAVFSGELAGDSTGWAQQLESRGIVSPWLIKASGGGGGRGMRVVHAAADLPHAIERAASEALAGFGNPAVFIERYLTQARHIEIQVVGDGQGGGVALAERECSLQRRHQKVVEEAPSPVVDTELRQAMGKAALRFVQETKYRGAGTVEFLLASDGSFHFLEVNTRLQVEHPVTEMVFGVDLVEAQLAIAQGEWPAELGDPAAGAVLEPRGHAIEVRILAEDPLRDFAPTPGTLVAYREPAWSGAAAQDASGGVPSPRVAAALSHQSPGAHVRLESALVAPGHGRKVRVNPSYDSMVAKLIGFGPHREAATQAVLGGLREFVISGFSTNIDFLQSLLAMPEFARAEFHTRWLELNLSRCLAACLRPSLQELFGDLGLASQIRSGLLGAVATSAVSQGSQGGQGGAWGSSFQNGSSGHSAGGLKIQVSPAVHALGQDSCSAVVSLSGTRVVHWARHTMDELAKAGAGHASRGERKEGLLGRVEPRTALLDWADGAPVVANVTYSSHGILSVNVLGVDLQVDIAHEERMAQAGHDGPAELLAPMPGKIISILAHEGQSVPEGMALFVLESMKMQIEIKAPKSGVVFGLNALEGQLVDAGLKLCAIKENEQ